MKRLGLAIDFKLKVRLECSVSRETTKNFEFEGLHYQLVFSASNSITLGVVAGRSARYQLPYDPFEKWGEQEHFVVDDINALHAPVSLLRAVLQAIYDWIASERPGYFVFSASTDRKVPVYDRIADRIAARMGYSFVRDSSAFHFFRPQSGSPLGRLSPSQLQAGKSVIGSNTQG